LVSSLAKAFGAGLAMLGGVRDLVERFEERSETRVHSSPPSLAVLHAAERALAINARSGDRIRGRLSRLAARLREDAPHACSAGIGGLFPVFTPELPDHLDVAAVHNRLLERGVRTVLHAGGNGRERGRLSLIVTAAHQAAEVDTAAAALRAVIAG
jgi:8-amino-7-oxononanoate synthase